MNADDLAHIAAYRLAEISINQAALWLNTLGPVNTKDASANAVIGTQSKARGAAEAIRLGETCNAALRPSEHVPEGLFPKRPWAALQSFPGGRPRLRFAPLLCVPAGSSEQHSITLPKHSTAARSGVSDTRF